MKRNILFFFFLHFVELRFNSSFLLELVVCAPTALFFYISGCRKKQKKMVFIVCGGTRIEYHSIAATHSRQLNH